VSRARGPSGTRSPAPGALRAGVFCQDEGGGLRPGSPGTARRGAAEAGEEGLYGFVGDPVDLGLRRVLLDPEEHLEHQVRAAELRQLVGGEQRVVDVERGARLRAVEILRDLAAPFLRPAVVEGAAKFGESLRLGDADAEHVLAEARQEEGDQRLADDPERFLNVLIGGVQEDFHLGLVRAFGLENGEKRCCLSGK
jgi:hypothetical protein